MICGARPGGALDRRLGGRGDPGPGPASERPLAGDAVPPLGAAEPRRAELRQVRQFFFDLPKDSFGTAGRFVFAATNFIVEDNGIPYEGIKDEEE